MEGFHRLVVKISSSPVFVTERRVTLVSLPLLDALEVDERVVEGDRGHLLDENVFQRQNPINVRGNAYSFAMPWDQIAAKLSQVVKGEVAWDELPQNEELLSKTVLFNLRIGNVDRNCALPANIFISDTEDSYHLRSCLFYFLN